MALLWYDTNRCAECSLAWWRGRIADLEAALATCHRVRCTGALVREAVEAVIVVPPPDTLVQVGQLIAEDAQLHTAPEDKEWP